MVFRSVFAAVSVVRRCFMFAMSLWMLGPLSLTAAPTTAPRSTGRVTLTNSYRELPAAQKATLHAITAAHLADNVAFNLPLSLRNQAELEARVNAGEVLSAEELKANYFPLQTDYDLVAQWLKGEGFTVDEVGEVHLAVFAHGTVTQVQNSFQTTMGLITNSKGTEQAVPEAAPSLPATIAGVALGVDGLGYHPHRPRLVPTPAGTAIPAAVPSGGYHIADIRKAYSGATLTVNGTKLDGTGQTIGIEAYLFPIASDLSAFWNANGITRTGTITTVNLAQSGTSLSTDTNDLGETELDVEWASGIAPGANIVVYATNENDFDDAERIYARALSDAQASGSTLHTFSSSYGPTEAQLTTTEKNAYNNYFLSMTAAGLTYLNASGDIGSGKGSTLTPEAYGDCPYATGVGGTNLQVNTSTDARTSEVVWGRDSNGTTSGSSGGLSKFFAKPAWQTGTGTPTGSYRGIPDIALAADYINSPAYYYTNGAAGEVGGTSWSAPTFAGFFAMILQGRTLNTPARGPLGFVNPRLYPLIGTANFYDVTSGNNGAYTATTGYDLCTGVGVPTVSTLLTTWLGPTITSFTPTSGAAGTSVVITGTNFYPGPTSALTVTFNGTAAASVTVNSATQVTAVAPNGVTNGPIVVTSFGDAATSATNFTVPAPDAQIVSSSPSTVKQGDNGDQFTLTVSNAGTAATSGTTTAIVYPGSGLYLASVAGSGWTCVANSDGSGNWTCTYASSVAAGSSFPALTASVNISPTAPTTINNGSLTGHVTTTGDANSANDTSTVHFTIAAAATTPTQQWRYQYFSTTANTGSAADTANPAGDGIPNLLKYALGLDPTKATVSPITVDISTGYLRLTTSKNASATDLTYSVQVNGDLTNPAGWTTTGTTIDQNTSTTLQVRDTTPVSGNPQRFLRLQVTR